MKDLDRRVSCCSGYCEACAYYLLLLPLISTQTIITTAVPTITAHFHSSEGDYTWIGSAYLLAAAAATPTWGKISDIWGRKPIILLANAIFFVASLIAALSINVEMLIAGRVIQGIGGGGLLILANICISDLFSMRFDSLSYRLQIQRLIFSQRPGKILWDD